MPTPAPVTLAHLGAPLAFEPNAGRFPAGLDYLASARGVNVAVGPAQSRVSIGHRGAALTTRLVGATADPRVRAQNKLPGKVNWYAGGDRSHWRNGLSTFGRVRYRGVYPGVDLVYYGHAGALEYDFVVAPGARPGRIAMALSGAQSLRLSPNGDLIGSIGGTAVRQLRPVAYQRVRGVRRPVSAGFALDGHRVSFRLGSYDHSQPLVIDPVLSFSDYIGGTGSGDNGRDVAVDSDGNAYVVGETTSPSFPGTSTTNPAGTGQSGFVMKIAPGGGRSWITYLGEYVTGVAVGPGGSIYISGKTSNGLAVTGGAAQGTYGGGAIDAFAGRLNADGTRNWVTYLGGTGTDYGDAIAVDGTGNAYVGGYTGSAGLATSGVFQTAINGAQDGLLAKYNPAGAKQFVTYLGGSSTDQIEGVDVVPGCASSCDVFVGGLTVSSDFPASAGLDGSLGGGGDAFIGRFNSAGGRLWATTTNDSAYDHAYGLAVTNAGKPAITGSTGSQAFVRSFNAGTGAAEGAINSFGASGSETGKDLAFDAQGNAYMVGDTDSSSGFNTTGAVQPNFGGQQDAFVVKFKADLTVFPVWSTYLGGFNFDYGYGIATDSTGGAWVVGHTGSNDFPTASPTQGNSTPDDAFVSKIQIRPATVDTGPAGTLRSHTASFTYSSGEPGGSFRCRLVPVESDFSACPNSGRSYSSLADGDYTFEVSTVDAGSTPGQVTQRPFTVDTKPRASLVIAPNPVLVGRTVTFDGSGSSAGDQPIVKYEWDIDGDGSFERDTGTTPTTTGLFDAPLVRVVSLRVTDAAGAIATATAELHVNAITGPSQFGVTVNNGAQFTRSPDVTVTANFPAGTSSLLFSNDGGFLEPTTFKAQKATKWKLDSSGPERLPKTIYVRFLNGPIVSETHQDDIILDEVPPKVTTAQVAPAGATSSSLATAARLRSWKVKVKAKDSNSGVSKLQVTSNKKRPGKALKYKTRLKVKSKKRPRWIRARDRAGNWSHWKKAR